MSTGRRLRLRRREASVQRAVPPPRQPEGVWPRLRVWHITPGFWCWRIDAPGGELLDSGTLTTHAQALAVGLAALEQATVGSSRP